MTRELCIAGLCLALGAQDPGVKKDPLKEALGGGRKGRASELGFAGIEAALKGVQAESALAMASQVVGLLGTLTAEAEQALAELERAQAEEARALDKVQQRRRAKDEYMAEYRQGLFCSGCQKSKSEIERKGESFPHPGQHIVRPTRDEIDAKDQDLQVGVNEASAEWRSALRRSGSLKEKVDGLLDQIPQGHALWCTASTYARNLAARGKAQSTQELRAELREAERRADDANGAWLAARGPKEGQAWEAKQATRDAVERIQKRLKVEQRRAAEEQAMLARTRDEHTARLAACLDRPHLRRALSLNPAYAASSRMAESGALGGRFLMGRLPSPSAPSAPLASVQAFLAEFRACDPSSDSSVH